VGLGGNPEKFEPVSDQPIAVPLGDLPLQDFDLGTLELDHSAGLDVDEVIMMLVAGLLVARSSVSEIVPLENVGLFEQSYGAINGGNADARINSNCPTVNFFDVWMIGSFGEHPGNNSPLPGHFHSFFDAKVLDT
jgi:hypothetical protein